MILSYLSNRPTFWLFLFFLSVYFLSAGGHLYSADTEIKALIAEGIVERHSVALPRTNMMYMVPGRGGLSYAPFPVGTSITMIPFYIMGDALSHLFAGIPRRFILEFCFSLINQVATALTCVVVFALCRRLRYAVRTALATTFIYGFCTITWPYAKTGWSEPQATLCVLTAFYCILRFSGALKPGWAVLAGLLTGYAITTKHEMGLYLFLLAGLLVRYLRRHTGYSWRRVVTTGVAYGIPLAVFGFLNLYYNYLRFERWFDFGHYASVQLHFTQQAHSPLLDSFKGIIIGIYQHLFSAGKSILVYSPPLMLFYWAMQKFRKAHQDEAIFCLAVPILFFIGMGSSWQMSGMAWGERYFVSLTPFLVLPLSALLAPLIERRGAYMKKSVIALTAAGICIQMIAVSANFQTTVEKLLSRGEEYDVQRMSYDPEYSPVYLNFIELLSKFSGTWRLLTEDTGRMVSARPSPSASLTPADFDRKALRDAIRYHTFDFWFLYMYFVRLSVIGVAIIIILQIALIMISGRQIYHKWWMAENQRGYDGQQKIKYLRTL